MPLQKPGVLKVCGSLENNSPFQNIKDINSPYNLESKFRYCAKSYQALAGICVSLEQMVQEHLF